MAVTWDKSNFIETILPIVAKYAKEYGYPEHVVPAIVGQACVESGYGTSYFAVNSFNFFGIRVSGDWHTYSDMDAGVKGYFDILDMKMGYGYIYGDLRNSASGEDYLMTLAMHGYAGPGQTEEAINNKIKYGNDCINVMHNQVESIYEAMVADGRIDHPKQETKLEEEPEKEETTKEEPEEPLEKEEITENNDEIEENNSDLKEITEENNTSETIDTKPNNNPVIDSGSNYKPSSSYYNPAPSYSKNTVVSSDTDLIPLLSELNNINNSSVFDSSSVLYTESNATIPNNIKQCQDAFTATINDLKMALGNEIQTINSVVVKMNNLDKSLAQEVSNMDYLSNISFLDEEFLNNRLFNNGLAEYHIINDSKKEDNCISKEDLLNCNKAIIEDLEMITDNSSKVINGISELKVFINSKVSGDVWNLVVSRLDTFEKLYEQSVKYANFLEEAIEKAIAKIDAYMGDYTYLDESELPAKRSALIAKQNELNGYLSYSDKKKKRYQSKINTLQSEIAALKNDIEKLEGLKAVINEAEEIIEAALTQVYNEYGENVQNIIHNDFDSVIEY